MAGPIAKTIMNKMICRKPYIETIRAVYIGKYDNRNAKKYLNLGVGGSVVSYSTQTIKDTHIIFCHWISEAVYYKESFEFLFYRHN